QLRPAPDRRLRGRRAWRSGQSARGGRRRAHPRGRAVLRLGVRGLGARAVGGARDPHRGLDGASVRALLGRERAPGMRRSTLVRSLAVVAVCAVVLLIVSENISDYRNTQLAAGAYYFAVLA